MAFKRILLTSAVIAATSGLAFAGSHGGNPAVKARQSHMQLYQHNLNIIGAMAKGEAEYDAEAATAAANNIVALTNMSQAGYWPEGSDTEALGEETRALPALWADFPKVMESAGAVKEAAANLASVAGTGQEALGPALGQLGGACTECHKAFRQSNN